ncbi:MAG TPA: hypothetical protein H9671_05580 [Firmicutes bacterium]|nr:hypothetical protein [Bacillota bacterium]
MKRTISKANRRIVILSVWITLILVLLLAGGLIVFSNSSSLLYGKDFPVFQADFSDSSLFITIVGQRFMMDLSGLQAAGSWIKEKFLWWPAPFALLVELFLWLRSLFTAGF